MARCPPTNQHTAKTKTTQADDHRASKWVIVIDNDLVWGFAKQTPQLRSKRGPVGCAAVTLTSNSRQDEKRATDKSKKQTHNPKFAFPCERGNRRNGDRDLKHGHATREHFVFVKI
jgi:hypothetical protein